MPTRIGFIPLCHTYFRLTRPNTDHVTTEKMRGRKSVLSHNSYSVSSIGVMLSHPSLLLNRNPKRVSKFYQKQSNLMENFKKDITAIEVCFLTFITFFQHLYLDNGLLTDREKIKLVEIHHR